MKKYNTKAIIVALLVLLVGGLLAVADVYWIKTFSNVWISIGCSLIASALVILLNTFLVDVVSINPLDEWKIKNITSTRAEINNDCEIELDNTKHQVDVIAFGLSSFRSKHNEEQMLRYLRKGVNFRILTMNPSSTFLLQREKEENDKNIKNSIETMIAWADKLNQKSSKGKIIVKGYAAMTLDFYWRADGILYVGPYWYGKGSQQTITYKYLRGGKGFKLYSEYFEELWENTMLTEFLTKEKAFRRKN